MKVLMVCSGGLTSGIIANAIMQEAAKEGFELEVKAIAASEFEDEVKTGGYNLAIVAPQVKYKIEEYLEPAKEAKLLVVPIVPMTYTPVGAPKILEQIKEYSK